MTKRWMNACLLAFSIFATHAHSQEYDDPAVAVCQFRHFLGRDPASMGYKRASTSIAGTNITLVYERSVLNTRPKEETVACQFTPNIEGNFVFAVVEDVEAARCKAEVAAGEKEIEAKQLGVAETSMIRTRLDRCEKLLQVNVLKAANASKLEKILSGYGLYPVQASDTAMRAQ